MIKAVIIEIEKAEEEGYRLAIEVLMQLILHYMIFLTSSSTWRKWESLSARKSAHKGKREATRQEVQRRPHNGTKWRLTSMSSRESC